MKLNYLPVFNGCGGCGVITTIFAYLGILVGEVLCLIFGILALTTGGPFEHQNITVGVTLLVLAFTGVGCLGGFIAGAIVGGIIGSPAICCDIV